MAVSNKSYLEEWELYAESKLATLTVDRNETAKEQAARIARLEAKGNEEAWIKYYFPGDADNPASEPADFQKKATQRLLNNTEWYEVRMWSRDMAKSTRTMHEALLMALRRFKRYIMLTSSSNTAADMLLMPYKWNLENNPRIINDYGVQEGIREWTSEKFRTKSGVTFLAMGAGQAPRGSKDNKNTRPDLLIYDDIDTDEDCRNPQMIKKKWDWIENASMGTRSVSRDTIILFCGNRIAADCCVVRASKFADHTDEVNITYKVGDTVYSSWPQKNPLERILRVLAQKSYASVQREYYNNPITEGSVFKKMAWKAARPIKEYGILVCYTDPSFKSTVKNDYKAVVLVGKWKDEYHVIKAFVEQTTTAIMIQWYYEIMRICGDRSCYFLMEEVFLSELIKNEVYARTAGGKSIPLVGDKRSKDDKFTRIETLLEPLNRNGKLYLNADEQENTHMLTLEEQFIAIAPGSRAHDDGPDAVEGAVWIINSKSSYKGEIYLFDRPTNPYRL